MNDAIRDSARGGDTQFGLGVQYGDGQFIPITNKAELRRRKATLESTKDESASELEQSLDIPLLKLD